MNKDEQLKPSRQAVLLSVCTVAAVARMLVSYARIAHGILPYTSMDRFAVCLGAVVLLGGTMLLRSRPRLGYMVAAVGAVLPLPWIFRTESRAFGNSWIAMNASWSDPDVFHYMRYSQLRIVSVALLLMSLIWAITRLLPPDWQLRNLPVKPANVACNRDHLNIHCVVVRRFRLSLSAADNRGRHAPGTTILNVKKDGIAFHETRVSIYRDGRYYVVRNDRQLFRYSFGETTHEGLLTDDLRTKLKVIQALPELKRTMDKSPSAQRARHSEGWYTEMESFAIAAFTTETATPPPAPLVAFLREVEGVPSIVATSNDEVRDVCLGFCYDPKAGLGYRAENQRCAERENGKEDCY
jgi:hypothetical protein